MFRRLALCLIVLTAQPVFAQTTPYDDILSALRAKGYIILVDERTWLGRQRVVADNGEHRRELVFNPGTGEIFRDYAVLLRSSSNAVAANTAPVESPSAVPPVAASSGELPSNGLMAAPPIAVVVDPGVTLGDPIVATQGEVAD